MSTRVIDARVLGLAMASMVLLWLSFPPVGLAVLGWVALTPLVYLLHESYDFGRRQYGTIWLASLLYWLATFYFIPLPHPALWVGWIVISIYLACYLPLFMFFSRALVDQANVPLIIAVPISWVALEVIRNYLFTGMGLVCLSHTQYRFPLVIQIADLSGAYTLSFVMMVVCAAVAGLLRDIRLNKRVSVADLIFVSIVLAATLGYGHWRLQPAVESLATKPVRVVLVQGSIDTIFPQTEDESLRFIVEKWVHYKHLNAQAAAQWNEIDLVIWPENGWPVPDWHPDMDQTAFSIKDKELYNEVNEYNNNCWQQLFANWPIRPSFLVGAVTVDLVREDDYGSAIFFDPNGNVVSRYYKNHLVMFGEYVPGATWIPVLRHIPAIGRGLVPGTDAVTIQIAGRRFAPSICFESTVPHYIRRQYNRLIAMGQRPDVLVNITNDGWFFGTSCLDFHLACNVFRAVEMRTTHLVCANTGFSAHIDSAGRLLQQGPRRDTAILLAEINAENADSLYRRMGDLIPFSLVVLVVIMGLKRQWLFRSARQH